MSRAFKKSLVPLCAILVVVTLVLGGCSGGSSGGYQPVGTLVSVSFLGYFPTPGVDPNPNTQLPTVFRDQALEFTFDGPMDSPIMGGFFSQGGTIVEFQGVPPAGASAIPYYAFVDQFAAHNALQIWENTAGQNMLASYVVGRHRDKPNTLVLDPRVPNGNPLGLPINSGFKSGFQYVFIIPANSSLLFSGHSAMPVGPSIFALPIVVPPFTTQPLLSGLFQASASFGPDPIPPAVLTIVAGSGHAGTVADPILQADTLIVFFTKAVTAASIDTLKNYIIRNDDFPNASYPNGVPVPGTLQPSVVGASADSQWIFTPSAPYGPGTSGPMAHGYNIEVRVGDIPYPQPNTVVPPILGVPTGLSGTQLEISNSMSKIFRSTPCVGCQTPASIVEGFDDSSHKDATFSQIFGGTLPATLARWNDSSAPSQLAGRVINGSPTGNTTSSLGTRLQYIVDPTPYGTSPAGLFSPFDASAANSNNQCGTGGCNLGPAINPGGGSHILHEYEFADPFMAAYAGEPVWSATVAKDSLEQIEWTSVSGVTFQTIYPHFSIWCGVTSTPSPFAGGGVQGLTSVFDANYLLIPYQSSGPASVAIPVMCNLTVTNPRKVACGLDHPYPVTLQTTQFYPFPVLNPPFDWATSTGANGGGANPVNLLYEVNIEPGTQVPNFNRYRANAFQPVRRLLDKPISLVPVGVCPFNNGGQFDVYRKRFTMVGIVAQGRSLWYDTGTADPNYLQFILTPDITAQPAGTTSTWILEGTDTSNPGPGTSGVSGTYIDYPGGPGTLPVTHPSVLTSTATGIAQKRYFRFKVEFRANNVANTTPAYSSVVMAYSF